MLSKKPRNAGLFAFRGLIIDTMDSANTKETAV